ncbi:NrdH-redoxin [candidate division Kazan bacterium]|uniref:NrdH-redoxin n=1 Tax=candidate division Kazan bacterium TaxID=2202143 RepID=A0A420ZDS0_UNCK3|nr:MAG: NrdH-redoxin [candidate division Kazan bacterium]
MKLQKYTIYSTPNCPYCRLLKNWLVDKGIALEEKDVSVDIPARQEMVEKSYQMGVPVSIIQMEDNGTTKEMVIVGFDQAKISQLLNIDI